MVGRSVLTASNVLIAVSSVLFLHLQEHLQVPAFQVSAAGYFVIVLSRMIMGSRTSDLLSSLPCLLFASITTAVAILSPLDDILQTNAIANRNKIGVSLLTSSSGLWLGSRPVAHVSLRHKLRVLALFVGLRACGLAIRRARGGERFDPIACIAICDFMFVVVFFGALCVLPNAFREREDTKWLEWSAALQTLLKALQNPTRWAVAIAVLICWGVLFIMSLVAAMPESNNYRALLCHVTATSK